VEVMRKGGGVRRSQKWQSDPSSCLQKLGGGQKNKVLRKRGWAGEWECKEKMGKKEKQHRVFGVQNFRSNLTSVVAPKEKQTGEERELWKKHWDDVKGGKREGEIMYKNHSVKRTSRAPPPITKRKPPVLSARPELD